MNTGKYEFILLAILLTSGRKTLFAITCNLTKSEATPCILAEFTCVVMATDDRQLKYLLTTLSAQWDD